MKRAMDVTLAALGLVVLSPIAALVALAVASTSRGPVLYWSDRVGRHGTVFRMPKFRTMRVGTPALATDKLDNPTSHLTPIGGFLRASSLDEIPQLWSILRGDMSLVGPRPALFNQHALIQRRKDLGIDALRPGLTGWAQVNGRDYATEEQKVMLDAEYMRRNTPAFDGFILLLTVRRVVSREGVRH